MRKIPRMRVRGRHVFQKIMIIHRNAAQRVWYYRCRNMRLLFLSIAVIFGIFNTANAAVHFMGMDGSSRGTLDVADDGANKGKVVAFYARSLLLR
jgi:hypothetical protein